MIVKIKLVVQAQQCECGGVADYIGNCAAYICWDCGRHQGLTRCSTCGWSQASPEISDELKSPEEPVEAAH